MRQLAPHPIVRRFECPDDARRNPSHDATWWNLADHNRACGDDGVIANLSASQNKRRCADPNIVTDDNRFLADGPFGGYRVSVGVIDVNHVANLHLAADLHRLRSVDVNTIIHEAVMSYVENCARLRLDILAQSD